MPSTCCSAYHCAERGGHLFPSDPGLREEWRKAVSRKYFLPSNYSVLCRKHFTENDYIKETHYNGRCDLMLDYFSSVMIVILIMPE